MKWSVLIVSVILIASLLLFESQIVTSVAVNYVTPTDGCLGDKVQLNPCHTLEHYANQQDIYFTDYSSFYFFPGLHRLEEDIRIIGVHSLSFQGELGNGMVKIAFNSAASIRWENCSDIEITSLIITLLGDNFTYSIVFECTHSVQIFNITILGNENYRCSSILSKRSVLNITNSQFIGIHGCLGAALMITASSEITFIGFNTLKNNVAIHGGAIYLSNSVLTVYAYGENLFMNNSASRNLLGGNSMTLCKSLVEAIPYYYYGYGGAIFGDTSSLTMNGKSNITFAKNEAGESGGAIAMINGNVTVKVCSLFCKNNANYQGGAILLKDVNSNFLGSITLNKNTADFGGAMHIANTNISFNVDEAPLNSVVVMFQHNAADRGGAIESHGSSLTFAGEVVFKANSAEFFGGAMSLLETSNLILVPILNMSFIENHANNSGGALYLQDIRCLLGSLIPAECFISIRSVHATTINISLHFENNSAGFTGSTLYGGLLNKCRLYFRTSSDLDKCGNQLCNSYSDDALEVFMNISKIIQPEASLLNISSQAKDIKLCQQDTTSLIDIYPGEQLNITITALDIMGSPVLEPINILVESDNIMHYNYNINPFSQNIEHGLCANATFRLYSAVGNTDVRLTLYPKNPCGSLAGRLTIDIHIRSCPIGFQNMISEYNYKCVCHKRVQKFTQNCYIDTVSIERLKNNFWISQINGTELIIHDSRCPLDYCINNPVNVTIESDSSIQCDFNRTGIVCGQCLKNFSLALGSLHCIPCYDYHAALIIMFALAGVALVFLCFILQLTVSVGTLNGPLFYANIIQANHQAFFPRATINFFTVFISWQNLDIGIETCFYNGMDIYAYSCFQFLFPFYVWFLIGLIILASHYFQSIAKRLGQNPVAVLATVLLLSYSKIIQAIIAPLSLTSLTYYNSSNDSESHQIVWLYDGSIGYFREPKHTALGLFAIFALVVFILPYISLLLFGHWLQGCSNWWILSWLNKIKPLMDAYHAPYKKHTQFWTGLLLLSRLGLFLTFAVNANGSESVNILAVSSVSIALLAIKLLRVYENLYKDILESSFILNLVIFSVATFYLKEESKGDESQLILSSISIGIAFVTFIGIIVFQISHVLKSSKIWKMHMLPFIQKSLLLSKILQITPIIKVKATAGDKDTAELQALPTSTEVDIDLREPLLEITESQATA